MLSDFSDIVSQESCKEIHLPLFYSFYLLWLRTTDINRLIKENGFPHLKKPKADDTLKKLLQMQMI